MGDYCLRGIEFLLEMMKKLWRWIMVGLHNVINVLNATALYTLKG